MHISNGKLFERLSGKGFTLGAQGASQLVDWADDCVP
jgi:hypothetical protein